LLVWFFFVGLELLDLRWVLVTVEFVFFFLIFNFSASIYSSSLVIFTLLAFLHLLTG